MTTWLRKAGRWLSAGDDEPVWPLPRYTLDAFLLMAGLTLGVLGYGVVCEGVSPVQLYPFAVLALVTASHIELLRRRVRE